MLLKMTRNLRVLWSLRAPARRGGAHRADCRRPRPSAILVLLHALLLAGTTTAQSTWTGAISASWSEPGNWSPPGVPTAADDVVISPAAILPSTQSQAVACASLTVQAGAGLAIPGNILTVHGDVTVEASIVGVGNGLAGLLMLGAPASLSQADGTVLPDLEIATGALVTATTSVASSRNVFVRGALIVAPGAGGATELDVGYVLRVFDEGSVTLDADLLHVAGTIDVQPGAQLVAPTVSTALLDGGGTLDGIVDLSGATLTAGALTQFDTTSQVSFGPGEHVLTGSLRLQGMDAWHPDATLRLEPVSLASVFSNDDELDPTDGLPPITMAGPGTAWLSGLVNQGAPFSGFTRVRGDVVITGGIFGTGERLAVDGDLSVSNATWVSSSISSDTIELAGDALLQAVDVSNMGRLQVVGSFTADASFVPGAGEVVFAGAGPQLVQLPGPAFAFHDLRVAVSAEVSTDLPLAIGGQLNVDGTLDATSRVGTVVAEVLDVSSGGWLRMDASSLAVGGELTVHADAGSVPGRLDASSAAFILLDGGATLDGAVDFSGGTVTATYIQRPNVDERSVLAFGPGEHLLTGSLRLRGVVAWDQGATLRIAPAAGTFAFVESYDDPLDPTRGLPPTTFEGPGNGWLSGSPTLGGVPFMRVRGDLTVEGGQCLVGNAMQVDGDLVLLAGQWGLDGGLYGSATVLGDLEVLGAGFGRFDLTCHGGLQSTGALIAPDGILSFAGEGRHLASTGREPLSLRDLEVGYGTDLTVTCGSLAVARFLQVDGRLDLGDALVDVGAEGGAGGWLFVRTIALGAEPGLLVLGGGQHVIRGSLLIEGTLVVDPSTTFAIRPDAGSAVAVVSADPLPTLRLDGDGVVLLGGAVAGGLPYTPVPTFVGGDLLAESGTMVVYQPTTIGGEARLDGGDWDAISAGSVLIVQGDTHVGGVDTTQMGPLRCFGDLLVEQPVELFDTVEFASTAPQTIEGAALGFEDLRVVPGSLLVLGEPLWVHDRLDIDGFLVTQGNDLRVDGVLDVAPGGVLSAGAAQLLLADDVLLDGKVHATGPAHFVADHDVLWRGGPAGILGDLTIDVSGHVDAQGPQPGVGGDLRLVAGDLRVAAGASLHVGGGAAFEGGTLATLGPTADVDVAGAVTFSGTTATGVYTLRCGGDWTADGGFSPTYGRVILDGAQPSTLASTAPGQPLMFHDLVVAGGPVLVGTDVELQAASLAIEDGGALRVGVATLTCSGMPIEVHGLLDVEPGGVLALGPTAALHIAPSGVLELVGTAAAPASIVGAGGGGYTASVDGRFAARHAVIADPGAQGLEVTLQATVGPVPFDLRGVTFTRPDASASSRLLSLERETSAVFPGVVFEDPRGDGTFNVSVPDGAPVTFVGWEGAFGGDPFEDDPLGLVDWIESVPTELESFDAIPGAERVTLRWSATQEDVIDQYVLEWSYSSSGPFQELATLPPEEDHTYELMHDALVPDVEHFYRLSQVLIDGVDEVIATASATPYPSSPPPNVLLIGGPEGAYDTIAEALAVVSLPGTVLMIAPGSYPSFSIGAGSPDRLRLVADGTGPVVVSTLDGPVRIEGIPAGATVELSGLTVGSVLSGQTAIEVTDCAGTVIVTDSALAAGFDQVAIEVVDSLAVALQRTAAAGAPALRAVGNADVLAGRCELSSIELLAGARLRSAGTLVGSVVIDAASTWDEFTGVMPDLRLDPLVVLGEPVTLVVDVDDSASWTLVASSGLGWIDLPASKWEWVLLLDPSVLIPLIGGLGDVSLSLEVPPAASLLGLSLALQVVSEVPGSEIKRFSSVAVTTALP